MFVSIVSSKFNTMKKYFLFNLLISHAMKGNSDDASKLNDTFIQNIIIILDIFFSNEERIKISLELLSCWRGRIQRGLKGLEVNDLFTGNSMLYFEI